MSTRYLCYTPRDDPTVGILVHPRVLGLSEAEVQSLYDGTMTQRRAEQLVLKMHELRAELDAIDVAGHA